MSEEITGFELCGTWYPCESMTECLVLALQAMCKRDKELPLRLADLAPSFGRKRKFFAGSAAAVNPQRPDLEHFVREVVPGWFVSVNENSQTMLKFLAVACVAAGLTFGKDLRIPPYHT